MQQNNFITVGKDADVISRRNYYDSTTQYDSVKR